MRLKPQHTFVLYFRLARKPPRHSQELHRRSPIHAYFRSFIKVMGDKLVVLCHILGEELQAALLEEA
jgi:hypothetical protein